MSVFGNKMLSCNLLRQVRTQSKFRTEVCRGTNVAPRTNPAILPSLGLIWEFVIDPKIHVGLCSQS